MVSAAMQVLQYDAQLLVSERGGDRRATGEVTVQSIESMEAMFAGAGLVNLDCWTSFGDERHVGR